MVIKSWDYFLFESILYTSDDFEKILYSIKDDVVASDFISLINKDIRTNYNILKTTDKNDTIGFISDNQATTKLKSMNLAAVFLANSNKTTIGRIVKSILSDNDIKKTDREIEIFVNKFKAAYDSLNAPKDKIRIVSGEDIRYWYLSDRYSKKQRGILRNSCMRYEEAQDYLNIYVKNPNVCQLLIKVDEEEELESRALLWETNMGKYLDRIYYTDDSDESLLENWFRERYKHGNIYNDGPTKIEVQLENWTSDPKSELYPYMDSLPYYYATENKLYSYNVDVKDKKNLYYIQGTDGSHQPQDIIFSEYDGESYSFDDVVYSDRYNFYIVNSSAVWSNFINSYIPHDWASYSERLQDYIPSDQSVYVYSDVERKNGDFLPAGPDTKYNYAYDEITGEFYDRSLLFAYQGNFYLKNETVFTYNVSDEDKEKFYQIYKSRRYYSSKLDSDVFGFKMNEEEIMSKKDYYYQIYKNVIYQEFFDMLNSLRGKVDNVKLEQKFKELEEANEILLSISSYKYNNYIYNEYKTIDNFINWYKKMFTPEIFNEILKESEGNWWFSDFNMSNYEDREILYKVCLDPLSFYSNHNKPFSKFKEIENAKEEDFNRMISYARRIISIFLYKLGKNGYQIQSESLNYLFDHQQEFSFLSKS